MYVFSAYLTRREIIIVNLWRTVTKNYHGNYPGKFFPGTMYVNYIRAWTGGGGGGGKEKGVYSVSASFSIIRVAIATTVLRFRAF